MARRVRRGQRPTGRGVLARCALLVQQNPATRAPSPVLNFLLLLDRLLCRLSLSPRILRPLRGGRRGRSPTVSPGVCQVICSKDWNTDSASTSSLLPPLLLRWGGVGIQNTTARRLVVSPQPQQLYHIISRCSSTHLSYVRFFFRITTKGNSSLAGFRTRLVGPLSRSQTQLRENGKP